MSVEESIKREFFLVRWYRALGPTKFGTWALLNVYTYIDPVFLRLTNGKFSPAGLGGPLIGLVTTIGARSGLPRGVPLFLVPDGKNFGLIASRGGMTRHPAWYHNLKANPRAEVLVAGQTRTYTAHELEGEERERIWVRANQIYDGGYEVYQTRTQGRRIPVMLLSPISE